MTRRPFHGPDLPDVVMPRCEPERILAGQKVIVTGANAGIGRGIALALGAAGADVLVNYFSKPELADEVVGRIEDSGSRAIAHRTDVTQEDQVVGMFDRMKEEFGTVDILVNNAGIQLDAAFTDMTLDQWNGVLNVNQTGRFLCAREA
jgi:glucose 1-dehydrogenase